MAVHLMVEHTPLGKWSGRRRTNLRLVLSSARDKMKTKASVSLRKEEPCYVLARYCARPPICMERLERLADGRLLYRFKRPWRDGTTHIVMEPLEMLEKLAALVPAPKAHLVRYSGLLAPAAKWRSRIVPESSSSSAIESPALTDTAAMNAEWTGLLRIHAKSGGSVAPVADGE